MENFVRNTKLNIEEEIKRIEQQPIETLDKEDHRCHTGFACFAENGRYRISISKS